MNKFEDLKIKQTKNIVAITTLLFSLIGVILLFATHFGGWNTGTPSFENEFFVLNSQATPIWLKVFLVIIAVSFLAVASFAIIWLLVQLGLINQEKLPRRLNLGALISTGLVLVFTIVTATSFGIYVSDNQWWFEIGFYWSILGSFIILIFVVLYMILNRKVVEETSEAES